MKKMGCWVTPGKEKLIQMLPDWNVNSRTIMTKATDSTLIITLSLAKDTDRS